MEINIHLTKNKVATLTYPENATAGDFIIIREFVKSLCAPVKNSNPSTGLMQVGGEKVRPSNDCLDCEKQRQQAIMCCGPLGYTAKCKKHRATKQIRGFKDAGNNTVVKTF